MMTKSADFTIASSCLLRPRQLMRPLDASRATLDEHRQFMQIDG